MGTLRTSARVKLRVKVPIEKENKDDLEVVHRQDNDSDAPAEDHESKSSQRHNAAHHP